MIPLILLMVRFFPRVEPDSMDRTIDVWGIVTLVVAVVPLMLALSLAGVEYDWSSPVIIGLLALSAVSIGAFIFAEVRSPNPIMPLHIYSNQSGGRCSAGNLHYRFRDVLIAIIFIPLFFQGVLGASATSSGSFLTRR